LNKSNKSARSVVIMLGCCWVVCLLGYLLPILAQSGMTQRVPTASRPTVGRSCGNSAKKFVVGNRLNLKLLRCSGRIELREINFNANFLNVEGDTVMLRSADGAELRGEVSAHALSQYCINANLGLFFNRSSNMPITDPRWKPPTVFSLRLQQVAPTKFSLLPAPGVNLLPQTGGEFICEVVDGTATGP
jgi:hypothetical protein